MALKNNTTYVNDGKKKKTTYGGYLESQKQRGQEELANAKLVDPNLWPKEKRDAYYAAQKAAQNGGQNSAPAQPKTSKYVGYTDDDEEREALRRAASGLIDRAEDDSAEGDTVKVPQKTPEEIAETQRLLDLQSQRQQEELAAGKLVDPNLWPKEQRDAHYATEQRKKELAGYSTFPKRPYRDTQVIDDGSAGYTPPKPKASYEDMAREMIGGDYAVQRRERAVGAENNTYDEQPAFDNPPTAGNEQSGSEQGGSEPGVVITTDPVTGKVTKSYTPDYAGWLKSQQDNDVADSTPTGAKGFGQFLAENYGDIAGQYSSTVKDIDTQYRKGLATYGQMAENLGRSGLSRSGYSDYLSGNAYTAAQQQRAAARLYADQSLKDAKMKYSEYLTGLEAQQQAETQAQAQVDQQVSAELTNIASEMLNNGSSVDTIKQAMLQQGYSEDAVNKAVNDTVANTVNTARDNIANSGGLVGVEFDALTTRGVDDETVSGLKEQAKNHNNDILLYALGIDEAAGLPKDETGSKRAAAMESVKQFYTDNNVAEELQTKVSEDDGDILMDVALYMMDKNLIDIDRGRAFVDSAMGHTISEDRYNPTDEINNMDKLYELYKRGDGALTKKQYIERLKQIGKNTEEAFGDLNENLWLKEVNDAGLTLDFRFKMDGKNKIAYIEPSAFDVNVLSNFGTYDEKKADFDKYFIPGKTYRKTVDGKEYTFVFGTYKGRTAITYEDKNGKKGFAYNTKNNKGGTSNQKDNMALMAFMCTPE